LVPLRDTFRVSAARADDTVANAGAAAAANTANRSVTLRKAGKLQILMQRARACDSVA
jgi:hypothetical protein